MKKRKKGARKQPAPDSSLKGRVPVLLVLCFALIGIGVSIELSLIHYNTHTDPAYKSICAVNDTVNCETVARSPYSVFLGAPVSAWAVFGYIFIACFAAWGFSKKRLHPAWPFGVLLGLVGAAVVASSILAYISFTRIDSICLFCTALYVINVVLLGVMVVWAVKGRLNPFKTVLEDARAILSKPLALVVLLILAGGGGAGVATGITPYWQHARWTELKDLPTGVDRNGHHWIGARDPLVTIVEYSDYQCPFCRRAHKDMRLMAGKYADSVRLIHRHLPLDRACNKDIKRVFHARACEFAKAAECAAKQNAFWGMNDALFSIQETTRAADVDLEAIAVTLGLDRSQFMACVEAPEVPRKIKEDMAASRKLDVKGTPTFFIGAQDFSGSIPEIALENAVKRARKKK